MRSTTMEESIASEQGKTQGKDVADALMLVRNISPTPCCQHRSMLFIEHHDDRRNQLKQEVEDMTKKGPSDTTPHRLSRLTEHPCKDGRHRWSGGQHEIY